MPKQLIKKKKKIGIRPGWYNKIIKIKRLRAEGVVQHKRKSRQFSFTWRLPAGFGTSLNICICEKNC